VRPLDGVVVLDLTRFLPGAVATMALANFGAEVVKVEQPYLGDPARHVEGAAWLFEETNRGKKSVALDLRDERGKQLFIRLVKGADVVIESFRPNVMARLGLGYENLAGLNSRLIYASLTGYGKDGQYADLAGHDINYIAMSGLLDLISPVDGTPLIPDVQIADIAGGSSQLLIGILLALQAREKTGKSQRVDISMLGGLSALLTLPLAARSSAARSLRRGRELLSGAYACYSPYQTRGGRWLVVGALEPKFWKTLCHRIGCEQLIPDQFSPEPRQSVVKETLAAIFMTRTAEEWFEFLRIHDCCVTPVRTLQEAATEGHFNTKTLGIGMAGLSAFAEQAASPRLGEHSIDILMRSGVSRSELHTLRLAGVICV
jgi:crotonobetainyl-CoA:carnitine CoA-transferase CaiB-like acyl-CoA transferase